MKRELNHAAEALQHRLDEQNITCAELSRRTMVDAGTLRGIVTGKRKSISSRNLAALARYYQITMQELIDEFA